MRKLFSPGCTPKMRNPRANCLARLAEGHFLGAKLLSWKEEML
jgi:hypothetical protein